MKSENNTESVLMTFWYLSVSQGSFTSRHWSCMQAWNEAKNGVMDKSSVWWEVSFLFFSCFFFSSWVLFFCVCLVFLLFGTTSVFMWALLLLCQIDHSNSIELFSCSTQLGHLHKQKVQFKVLPPLKEIIISAHSDNLPSWELEVLFSGGKKEDIS